MDDEVEIRRERLEWRAGRAPGALSDEPDALRVAGLSRLAKLRRALVAVGAVLLAGAFLASTLSNTGATLQAALGLPTPAPTPPLPIGAETIIALDTVPWGVLRVDGRALRPPSTAMEPPTPQGIYYPAFALPRGRHMLTYVAPPFPELRCVLSVPAQARDFCPVVHHGASDAEISFGAARAVDLGAALERLPAPQLAALEDAVAKMLMAQAPATHTTDDGVAPGERYLTAEGRAAVATEPLTAALQYELAAQVQFQVQIGAVDVGGASTCRPLCADTYDQLSFSAWLLIAGVQLSWRYRARGELPFAGAVAPGQPEIAAPVGLLASYAGSWQVAEVPTLLNPICAAALAAIQKTVTGISRQESITSCSPAADAADGCQVTLPAPRASASAPTLTLDYRFGLLLAADAASRAALPALPLASRRVQALLPSLDAR